MNGILLLFMFLLILGGATLLAQPGVCLRRRKPPVIWQAASQAAPVSSTHSRNTYARCLRMIGACLIVSSVVALWLWGLSLGWIRSPASAAPNGTVLEKLVKTHAEPHWRQGKATMVVAGAISGTNRAVVNVGSCGIAEGAADAYFEIGSITKVFTGIALARGVEAGELRLDQKLQDLLPQDARLPAEAAQITLGHLASHTSGLPRLPSNLSPLVGLKMILWGRRSLCGL